MKLKVGDVLAQDINTHTYNRITGERSNSQTELILGEIKTIRHNTGECINYLDIDNCHECMVSIQWTRSGKASTSLTLGISIFNSNRYRLATKAETILFKVNHEI